MSFAEFFQAVHDTQFFTAVRESMLVYPIVMSVHLTCIAIFGGMILLTDRRLLGWAMTSVPVAEVIRQFRIFKWVGLTIMVTCGVLLFGAKATDYYDNPYFLIKISFLLLVGAHAWFIHRDVYGNPEALDPARVMPGKAKTAAYLSLFLWLGIMSMGRRIAYFEKPDPIHDRKATPPQTASQELHSRPRLARR
jgi:hypothetical protein